MWDKVGRDSHKYRAVAVYPLSRADTMARLKLPTSAYGSDPEVLWSADWEGETSVELHDHDVPLHPFTTDCGIGAPLALHTLAKYRSSSSRHLRRTKDALEHQLREFVL